MTSRFLILTLILSAFFLTGCATNRSVIDIKMPPASSSALLNAEKIEQAQKTVFINLPVDRRIFEKNIIKGYVC